MKVKKQKKGSKKKCKYYPCHKDLENCFYCYCPFYPCGDFSTGGKLIQGKNGDFILDCQDCSWIHQNRITKMVKRYFRSCPKKDFTLDDLHSIKMKLLKFNFS